MSKEILFCPHCKGESKLIKFISRKIFKRNTTGYFVECMECGCRSRVELDPDMAIKKWNARKPMKQIRGRLAEAEYMECDAACNRRNNNFDQSNGYVKGIRDAIRILEREGGLDE